LPEWHYRQVVRDGGPARKIAVATSDGSLPKLKHALSKVEVLALDDFGLGTFNDQASSVLLDVVERRYRAGRALLLTSQFLPEKWHALFPDPTVADAILDRIVHQSHVIQLTGESLRKQKAKGVPLA
jgi:DNA replication protein DnaC